MRPRPICDVAAIRALERAAAGAPLMERAGVAAAGQARLLAPRTSDPIAVFAGPGNNGGDAFVVARQLREWGYAPSVVFAGDPDRLPADAGAAYGRFRTAGGTTVVDPPALSECSLIVDGLFGIGLARPLAAPHTDWIAAINRAGTKVLALDVATGLDADTGTARGPAVCATHTATFIALKPGLLMGDGADLSGAITVHDLDLDLDLGVTAHDGCGSLVDWNTARAWLQPRRRNSHKGSYGTLAIIGGARGMSGAALLAARGALHAGAGKVIVGFVDDPLIAADPNAPELMLRTAEDALRSDFTALVVGPGLSQARHAADVLARALSRPVPLVLDADALNLLALEQGLLHRLQRRDHPTIVTPHPAEAARLLQASTGVVQGDRLRAARELATRLRASVALKGAGTVCAHADGSWSINATGNPGLASGGTGDVLAGLVGALVAQRVEPARALALGVCVHGAAADRLVGERTGPVGLTASELLPAIRALLNLS